MFSCGKWYRRLVIVMSNGSRVLFAGFSGFSRHFRAIVQSFQAFDTVINITCSNHYAILIEGNQQAKDPHDLFRSFDS